jgi:hypothetical protein
MGLRLLAGASRWPAVAACPVLMLLSSWTRSILSPAVLDMDWPRSLAEADVAELMALERRLRGERSMVVRLSMPSLMTKKS